MLRFATRTLILLAGFGAAAAAQDPAALFQTHCATCHSAGSAAGAPLPATLRQMTAKQILEALQTGKMREMAASLDGAGREAVAKYLGVPDGAQAIPAAARCAAPMAWKRGAPAWNAWGVDAANTRFQGIKAAGLTAASVPRLKLKWAFGFPGATTAFAPPTVAGGSLFVGSADGTVYSLDAQAGCVHWTFSASEGVRTAILISDDGKTAYFGDLHGIVYAVNAATGELRWKNHVDEHPFAAITGSPKLVNGRLYVPVSGGDETVSASNPKFECCTFRGSLVALDAASGKQIWKTYTIPDAAKQTGQNAAGTKVFGPSGVSLWSSPTIDLEKKVIYAGTGVNYTTPATAASDAILAFDMETGRMLWSQQITASDVYNFGCQTPELTNCPKEPGKDADFGHSPMLRTLGGGKRILVAGQKSGMVSAIDPDQQGKILWQTRIAAGGGQGGILWGGGSDDKGFADFGGSDWNPGNPAAGGGLVALQLATGKVVWSTPAPKPACVATPGCSAAQPAPVTAIPGVLFLGSMDGHLRAYDAKDGRIVWDFDTLKDFAAVNGVKAHGGSINAAGPVIAGGMVYSDAGYARVPSIAGNVLLAFSVEGK